MGYGQNRIGDIVSIGELLKELNVFLPEERGETFIEEWVFIFGG